MAVSERKQLWISPLCPGRFTSQAQAWRSEQLLVCRPHLTQGRIIGGLYEYMDDIVRDPVDRLDRWFHCVPCHEWLDSPFACRRSDLPDIAFRHGRTDSIEVV
jgi:hypothetical protein